MSTLRVACVFAATVSSCWAAGAWGPAAPVEVDEPKAAPKSNLVFSLWPKAFQKHPRMEFNVVTEFTREGRARETPTAQSPVYYVAQTGSVYNGGLMGPNGNLDAITTEQLQTLMRRSLAENGYREIATRADTPTVAIIYQFGSYAFNPPAPAETAARASEDDVAPLASATLQAGPPELDIRRALLNRAALLGGRKFELLVADAMERVDQKAVLERVFTAPDGGEDFMGSVGQLLPEPFERLRARSAAMERLVDELFSSSYFVIASAYDVKALGKGERRLLWRTKMTVNSFGLNMAESLPPLIATAAPYLGRETREPVLLTKRLDRAGNVQVGAPTIQ